MTKSFFLLIDLFFSIIIVDITITIRKEELFIMKQINDKKNNFMNNVGIILLSQFAVKLLGLIYRMVITNIDGFGDSGNGFYTTGFQIYTLLLAISSVGIPNAISKMISERITLKDYSGAHKIFKTALILFCIVGLVCSLLLFGLAGVISDYVINMPGSKYTIQSLAPSIFFVCVSSVIRGYFTGLQNMKATSTSQVLEQLFKSTLTIAFVILAIGQTPEIMSAYANFATSAATFLSFLYLIGFYRKNKPVFTEESSDNTIAGISTGRLAKSILMISIPISLGSVITAINRVIDTATITRGIEIAFANYIPHTNIFNPTKAQLQAEASRLAGMLGKSDTLINMPLALNIAFSTVLVPTISKALALGNKKYAASKVNYSFLISILLILPCCAGYIALAKPIYLLIYPNAPLGFELLQLSAVALIFTALNQTISGSLQGLGKVYTPATGLLIGCVVKYILNRCLIRIPEINIYGAAISSIVCQLISFGYSFTVLAKNLPLNMSLSKYVFKPIISSSVMGVLAFLIYKAVMLVLPVNIIAVAVSVVCAVCIYIVLTLKMNILEKSEIEELPAGAKLSKLFKKLKLIA